MITFGTLLWIDEKNHSSINNKNQSIVSYFRQVDFLAKTLRTVFNAELVVLTNNKKLVEIWFVANQKIQPRIIQISPSIEVPAGVKFFGAHFKIDALLAGLDLLKSDADRFFLLDTDVVANRKFDSEQLMIIGASDLIVYDISDQVFPTYGANRIKKDIELVSGTTFTNPKWFGGEFVGGNKIGLTKLIEQSRKLLPTYFSSVTNLHHIGDEMFISSAINYLMSEGELKIINQEPFMMMSRHWSRHTDHSLNYHFKHSFIHCPGSKPALEFMSNFASPTQFNIQFVLRCYQFAVLFYQSFKKIFK